MRPDLPARVIEFCRLLRERGLVVTPGRALAAMQALEHVDVADAVAFRTALKASLTISVDDFPAFAEVFDRYWSDLLRAGSTEAPPGYARLEQLARPPEAVLAQIGLPAEGVSGEGDSRLPGGDRSASDTDLLTHKDFRDYTAADAARARRLIHQLAAALATAPSRRWQAGPGSEVDLRRTIGAARRRGDAVELLHRRRRTRRLRLVALLDVSGSMDVYANYLLEFFFRLQNEPGSVRTFVFSTRLHEVSFLLRRRQLNEALPWLARAVRTWSGGTTIGRCLAEFNERYGRRLVGPRTVVIVASDGWERGDTDQLAEQMAFLHRRARSVIWLNPLRGREGYEPLAAGMAAALPYIDHFLAAGSLEALARLKRTLTTVA